MQLEVLPTFFAPHVEQKTSGTEANGAGGAAFPHPAQKSAPAASTEPQLEQMTEAGERPTDMALIA
jgi:hypothetical protein